MLRERLYQQPSDQQRVRNVFAYGRGVRERSEFYWLKASYFTLKFHPHNFGYLVTVHRDSPLKNLVPLEGIEPPPLRS